MRTVRSTDASVAWFIARSDRLKQASALRRMELPLQSDSGVLKGLGLVRRVVLIEGVRQTRGASETELVQRVRGSPECGDRHTSARWLDVYVVIRLDDPTSVATHEDLHQLSLHHSINWHDGAAGHHFDTAHF